MKALAPAPAPQLGRAACRRLRHAARAAAASGKATRDETQVTKEYLKWASESGIRFPKLTQSFFGALRGAEATAAIAPGEVFVSVPKAAALVVTPRGKCPFEDFVEAGFWAGAPWFVKMGVLLLHERRKGPASRVSGYVAQLPPSIDTPLRWAEAELAALAYPPVIQAVQQQRRQWDEHYRNLTKALKGPAVGREEFLWAVENVRSRSFSGPYTGSSIQSRLAGAAAIATVGGAYVAWAHVPLEQALNGAIAAVMFNIVYDLLLSKKLLWYALCPVIDSINHSATVRSEVAYEYFKDEFSLSTESAYAPGDQVFISYGPQANDSLLQFYGFVLPDNPHDSYLLQASVDAPGGARAAVQVSLAANGKPDPESLAAARAAAGVSGGAAADGQEAALQAALAAAAARDLAALAAADTAVAGSEGSGDSSRAAMAAAFRAEKRGILERYAARAAKRAAKLAAPR